MILMATKNDSTTGKVGDFSSKEYIKEALEAIREDTGKKNAADEIGSHYEAGKGLVVFIPENLKKDMPDPIESTSSEKNIKSCMKGEWAIGMADNFVGTDATQDARDAFKRNICKGLYD